MHPSAGIVRVGALALCVFAHFDLSPRTLCGDRACRSAPAVRFCACGFVAAHPLRGSCVSERSRCAFLRILQLVSHTLCGDRACRSAPAVRFCAFYNLFRTPSAGIVRVGALPLCVFAHFTTCFARPLRGSRVSERSRCAFLGILKRGRAPSAGIVRVRAFLTSSSPFGGARSGGKSTFCSTNVVRRGRQELP